MNTNTAMTPAEQNALIARAARNPNRAADAIYFWHGQDEDSDEMVSIVRGTHNYWDADTYIRETLCGILARFAL